MAKTKNNTKPRLNDDWSYLDERPLPEHPTTDQQFNITYNQSGMQSISNIRIVKAREKNLEAANDPTYNVDVTSISIPEREVPVKKLKQAADGLSSVKPKSRIKAGAVTASIASWYGTVYIIQLVFALLGVFFLGYSAARNLHSEQSLYERGVAFFEDAIAKFATGHDVAEISLYAFVVCHAIAAVVATVSLFTALFQYELAFLKPLGGTHAGLKQGTFLTALIGCLIPIVNLFPLMALWMAAVWKYPK